LALGEGVVEKVERTPDRYALKVRVLAAIYVALNAECVALIGIVWARGRMLVTLAQRSNVETLVLAIVLALALFYIATTVSGLVGAGRMLALNLSVLWAGDRTARERRKQRALRDGSDAYSVHFDKMLLAEGGAGPIRWEIADDAGRLGEIEIDRATATVKPCKRGLHNALLAFLTAQLSEVLRRRSPPETLTIGFWSDIEDESASIYRSAVVAFDNLSQCLARKPLWPTVELTAADIARIGAAIRRLVPALRDEALLPDLEYEVEYTVPIAPEPLAFLQLRRSERRADPVLSMGYALAVMSLVLVAVLLLVTYPPWVPSK
jgi:hypothetical protein